MKNCDIVETLLISAYKLELDENEKKKKSIPTESICINNLWYDTKNNMMLYSKKRPTFIDDIVVYDSETETFLHGKLSKINGI